MSFPGDAEIMEVSLTADDPAEAATLVQAVVDAYLREVVNTDADRKRHGLASWTAPSAIRNRIFVPGVKS